MITAVSVLAFCLVTFIAAPLAVYVGAARLKRPSRDEALPLFLFITPSSPFVVARRLRAILAKQCLVDGLLIPINIIEHEKMSLLDALTRTGGKERVRNRAVEIARIGHETAAIAPRQIELRFQLESGWLVAHLGVNRCNAEKTGLEIGLNKPVGAEHRKLQPCRFDRLAGIPEELLVTGYEQRSEAKIRVLQPGQHIGADIVAFLLDVGRDTDVLDAELATHPRLVAPRKIRHHPSTIAEAQRRNAIARIQQVQTVAAIAPARKGDHIIGAAILGAVT